MSAQSRMTKSRVTVQMQVDQIIQVNPTGHISVGGEMLISVSPTSGQRICTQT